MNAAQIDQTLEKLMLELQNFKRSSTLLADAGTKAEEMIAGAEAVLNLSEQIRQDNQRQVEAVQRYTATSEQNLSALAQSVTTAQNEQQAALKGMEGAFQQELKTLAKSIDSLQKRQEEAISKLTRSMIDLRQEQNAAHQRNFWLLIFIALLCLIVAAISVWPLLIRMALA